jgi:hypothetical protein
MDEQISQKKLYRLKGVLSVKVYRHAKRMDVNFTPYWRIPFDKIRKKDKVFEMIKLLNHHEEDQA